MCLGVCVCVRRQPRPSAPSSSAGIVKYLNCMPTIAVLYDIRAVVLVCASVYAVLCLPLSIVRPSIALRSTERSNIHVRATHTHSHHEPTNEMKRNNNKSNEKREKKTLQSSNGMIFSWLKAFNECTSAQSWCVEWIRFFSFSIEFRFCSLRSLATKCSGSVLILWPHDDDLRGDFGIKRNICRDDFIEIWTFSRRSYRLDFTFNCQRARFFPTAHAKNTNVHWIYWIEIPRRRGGKRDTSVSIYMQIEPFIDFLRFLRMNAKVSK